MENDGPRDAIIYGPHGVAICGPCDPAPDSPHDMAGNRPHNTILENEQAEVKIKAFCRKLLSRKNVEEITGYSRVTLWRKSRDPEDPFPLPVVLGLNKIGWFADEIAAWQEGLSRVTWAAQPDPEVA